MAKLAERPFPPGRYPVVVLGSGPGGLQVSYSLGRLGIAHAVLSADPLPGGMFRQYPLFQRLITWTKPFAPADRGTREYQRYDWNSLLAEEPAHQAVVADFMDGTSYFPSRQEMAEALRTFTHRAGVEVRYDCRWEATRREANGFVLITSDGEYSCDVLVVAVGMTEPWKPAVPGLEQVPHYVETRAAKQYADKRVFVIGKRNSGFEIADGLLPWARQILLGSPRPARISVLMHSTAAARARYLQPYEDHVLGGGVRVLDASIERVDRSGEGYRVTAKGTTAPGDWVFDVDEVIAATGFATPLRDLPELGVATFHQGRLPAQTPFWESASVPGIYFAGSITQGSIGLKKYGIPSNSAAVHGFRYNAAVLARQIARVHFEVEPERPRVPPDEAVSMLLAEVSRGPAIWNQQSYLARVLMLASDGGMTDEGLVPLQHFVDTSGPDAVAVTVETDDGGDIHPAVYVRRDGKVDEQTLPSNPMLDFETAEHRAQLQSMLTGLIPKGG